MIKQNRQTLQELFGDPVSSSANNTLGREIWVYLNNEDDSTATYFYIESDVVVETTQDEFSGTLEGQDWLINTGSM